MQIPARLPTGRPRHLANSPLSPSSLVGLLRFDLLAARVSSVSSSSLRSLSAHPQATAYGLGVVLLAIMAAGISSLFLFTRTAFVLAWAIIAVIISGVGLIFLVLGNIRRASLIQEINTDVKEEAEYLEKHPDAATQQAFVETMAEYKKALLDVGAPAQASQVSQLIVEKGGRPPGVKRDYNHVRGPVVSGGPPSPGA
jgi:hypothetical protein